MEVRISEAALESQKFVSLRWSLEDRSWEKKYTGKGKKAAIPKWLDSYKDFL